MDPELKQIIEQMQSLLEEASMISGDGATEEETTSKQEGESGLDAIMEKVSTGEALSDEEQKTLAAAINASKADDSDDSEDEEVDKATASDSAEERVDDVTQISEDTQNAVKALMTILKGTGGQSTKKAQKSAQAKPNGANTGNEAQVAQALATVAKSVQAINSKIETVGKSVEGIFDALEISDDVIKNSLGSNQGNQIANANKSTPAAGGENETAKVLKSIFEQAGIDVSGTNKSEQVEDTKSHEDVRKDLGTALNGIFAGGQSK